MTAKEYLSQAFHLDRQINSKLDQLASLNTLATKATSAMTGLPRNPSSSASQLEEVISKIMELEEDISHDIDELVDLKCKIARLVKRVEDPELQIILEKRYLCFMNWKAISLDMKRNSRYLLRKFGVALDAFEKVMTEADIK